MLTIFNPYTLLHYLTYTFINNSKQPSLTFTKLVKERKSSEFLCVF